MGRVARRTASAASWPSTCTPTRRTNASRPGPCSTRGSGTVRSRTLTVSTVRAHSGRLLVRFEEVPDRTVAEAMRGAQLLVDAADLPPSDDPDEFYDHELEGLAAVLADGTEVGTVREIARSPGGELLVIDLVDGARGARAVRPRDRARGGRRGRPRRARPARGPAELDAHRRRHDLPRVPGPACARRCSGRAIERGLLSRSTSTTCGSGPTTYTRRSTTARTAAARAWS